MPEVVDRAVAPDYISLVSPYISLYLPYISIYLPISPPGEQLHALFAPFGEIDKVDLHTEGSTGQSKGYGFVHFKLASDGKKCIDQMDGFELAGRAIKVSVRVGLGLG